MESGSMACQIHTESSVGCILAEKIVIPAIGFLDTNGKDINLEYNGIEFPVGLGINDSVQSMLLAAGIKKITVY